MSDVHCWLPGRGLGKKRERRAAFRIAGFQVLLLLSSYQIYLSIMSLFSFDRTVLLSTIFIVKTTFVYSSQYKKLRTRTTSPWTQCSERAPAFRPHDMAERYGTVPANDQVRARPHLVPVPAGPLPGGVTGLDASNEDLARRSSRRRVGSPPPSASTAATAAPVPADPEHLPSRLATRRRPRWTSLAAASKRLARATVRTSPRICAS